MSYTSYTVEQAGFLPMFSAYTTLPNSVPSVMRDDVIACLTHDGLGDHVYFHWLRSFPIWHFAVVTQIAIMYKEAEIEAPLWVAAMQRDFDAIKTEVS